MNFVNEDSITDAVIALEEEHYQDIVIQRCQDEQPVIMSYIFSESFDILNDTEKQYLLGMFLIVYESLIRSNTNLRTATEQQIGDAEEANWEVLSNAKGDFHDRLNAFFDDTKQEDLLAFAEDMLSDDESDEEAIPVEKEVRELIFVGIKSIIDALEQANP